MTDIIRLLPDNVANQIAAGEVVQRPASVVKELLENSVDAGANKIELLIKESGKAGILVIDNGSGMSESDARMAFERHATSKIQKAEDIFQILTKGFRGEALASIAAVAQVELTTRQKENELATRLRIEGSEVMNQEYCNAPTGTRIEVKNLFYNIPARRNFLKSDHVEMRHIIDEFERVALAHPAVHFECTHNKHNLFSLPGTALRQRIVNIFGKKFNEKLVPVKENTPILQLEGFIGKPEFAKKTRGEQFFFTNHRFIKNAYLHKAVCLAFEGLLSEGSHPSYFLFLTIDPARIDVNIHPTKTEIKFEDERAIHTIIRTAVKHALGQYNIAPSLDFETDQQFTPPPARGPVEAPGVHVNPHFNPFEAEQGKSPSGQSQNTPGPPPRSRQSMEWESLLNEIPEIGDTEKQQTSLPTETVSLPKAFMQIGKKYILTKHGDGMILIHQQRAHERILYEGLRKSQNNQQSASQQLLFPQNLSFSAGDFQLVEEMMPKLRAWGFDLDIFGKQEVVVQGIPLHLAEVDLNALFDELIEAEKDHASKKAEDLTDKMAWVMAKVAAIRSGTVLGTEEMARLTDELFACEHPYVSLNNKAVVVNFNVADIDKSFH